jgi:hypothetical protein
MGDGKGGTSAPVSSDDAIVSSLVSGIQYGNSNHGDPESTGNISYGSDNPQQIIPKFFLKIV